LAVYFYLKSRRAKEMVWSIRTSNLVSVHPDSAGKLKVFYEDRRVNTVSVSEVMLWERGAEPIRKGDIADGDPLRVEAADGVEFLGVHVFPPSDPATKISLAWSEQQRDAVPITFDFLNQGDGAIFRLVHTGRNSEDICIKGTIIGGKKPKRCEVVQDKRTYTMEAINMVGVLAVVGIEVFWAASQKNVLAWLLTGLTALLALFFIGYLLYRWFGPRGVPQGLLKSWLSM
jgi:hypothetical protein